tara:strand:+ start:926 stop:1378 length:453 start_codon:yes stop_codon:yes gene_type:complete
MYISLILLIVNGAQGYLNFKIYNASHIQFAFLSTIFYMFSQSWIMFYFIGSGKKIKEIILEYKFDKSIYNEVIISKKKVFPHITLNILFIGTVFVIGGGVHTQVISKNIHSGLFIISILHLIYLMKLQTFAFQETAKILTKLGILIEKSK